MKKSLLLTLLCLMSLSMAAFDNPILRGMNPDPSICRVGEDYYMATSSFSWTPGMPVYHSRDLVHWERLSYALPQNFRMRGIDDNDGIWAVTIRHHDGLFYLIANAHKCGDENHPQGGNFYITASDPRGPWSKPIWVDEAPGIDPSLFWDDDGRCYYTGNRWDFKTQWRGQCSVWAQEIDVKTGTLIGVRKDLTYGHATNAGYAEGPHIYKLKDESGKRKAESRYLLLIAEGGASFNHAVTAFTSKHVMGPYTPCTVNPVITHRHLGRDADIQCIGHADIVDTPDGDWWMVMLGNRNLPQAGGKGELLPIGRETFLCRMEFQDGNLIVNPGHGRVLTEMENPRLQQVPLTLSDDWYKLRDADFTQQSMADYRNNDKSPSQITLPLQRDVLDSLTSSAYLFRRITELDFSFTTKVSFSSKKDGEEAGLAYYRSANGYFTLMKGKTGLTLTVKDKGHKRILATLPYTDKDVFLRVDVRGGMAQFRYGSTAECHETIGMPQSIAPVCDNKYNKFNGSGIGIYATSNGRKSKSRAVFTKF